MRLPLLVTILSACVRNQGLPFVGDCAAYPDGIYEYGQIGIGDCLSGATSLAFVDPDDPVLLVTNANPYALFDGGSLLAIPWSEVESGHWAAVCVCGEQHYHATASKGTRLDPIDPGTARHGGACEFKDTTERSYLVSKLRENGWNISKTAEAIDTPRSNLYKKLEQYQISQESDG